MPTLPGLLILSIFFTSGLCTLYQKIDDLKQDQFDFVVVGGGTAGAALASRLSEEKDYQVLVIEAGPTNEGVLLSDVPYFAFNVQHTPWDWNFTTVPQKFAKGRALDYSRGFILGGSSAINLMIYTRGPVEDFDRWARVTGDEGWSWDKLFPYFLKNEHFDQPTDGRNVSGDYDPTIHNTQGMVRVTLPNELQKPFDDNVFAAGDELGGNFKYNQDVNSGKPIGLSWVQGSNGGGERSTSATAYLSPDIMKRKNLHVLLNTRITRIQKSNTTNSDGPEFDTVEAFGKGENKSRLLRATKELILSAGSVNTPHILFHSGFGDTQELKSVGVNPLVNLPSLGKNLTDHPYLWLDFAANSGPDVFNNATLLEEALDEWRKSKTGQMANIRSNSIVWGRLPPDAPYDDPSPGPNAPHWEIILNKNVNIGSGLTHHVTAGISMVTPASRGTITINSTNPFDSPLIDPAFYTAPVDLAATRDAIRSARKFYAAKAWEGYVISEADASAGAESDDELDAFISDVFVTIWHPVSTAMMTPKGADYGVVDPDLKVKGVRGLRIVDASVMPFIISGHPMAAVYAIAERAADMIKQDWKKH